ncbi:MAG TPA: hypothetical protein VMV92_00655 [Streptosporangiaceae bacterium]|nr:hypothetical protein [Streptosporangiaceae bacterium]
MTTPAVAVAGHGPAPAGAPAGANAPVIPPWPFPAGVFDEEIQNSYDQTVTATTAAKAFPDVEIEPDGWARGWWFDFDIVAVNATTNTVTAAEDFPLNAVNTVLLKGTNVPQTFGPFGGYDWGNVNKYGGYQPVGDPRNDQSYSVTSGTSTTAGSARAQLYLPLEVSAHDALGDLQNQSDNSVYRVAVTLESTAVMYTTAPTGAVTCELKVEQDSYSEPVAALALGGRPVMDAPPLPGSRQCWQQEDDTGIPGASHTTKVTNGIGFAYRNVIFKLMRAGTSRANGEADFPDPLEIWLGGTRVKRLGNAMWKTKMGRRYNLRTTTADTAGGPENGVRVLNWNQDVGMLPGDEARRKYFRTQDGNVFKVVGTYGHSGTLWITSNYVIPRGGPAANAQIVA